jgi:hypothetical protein
VRSRALEAARAAIREAGLDGQVRIGALPTGSPQTRSPLTPHAEPNAGEGACPLDPLLGLFARSPRGALIEITGSASSGRTSLATRAVLGATARGELAGWVDLPDALDPPSLARAGVRLASLLWVRPRALEPALRSAEILLRAGIATVAMDLEGAPRQRLAALGTSVWSRLARAARESRATAVLLGCAGAPAAFTTLALSTERRRTLFDAGLFDGFDAHADVLRNRTGPVGDVLPFRSDFHP